MTNEKLIWKALHQYYSYFSSRRWSDFEKFLDDNFIYCTDNCITRSKEEFVNHLRRHDWKGDSFSIKMLSFFDLAQSTVAVYEAVFRGTSNNEKAVVKAVETTVFSNSSGAWRILTCHSSNQVASPVG
jgi:hypothetical protein